VSELERKEPSKHVKRRSIGSNANWPNGLYCITQVISAEPQAALARNVARVFKIMRNMRLPTD
jgi:hypothetical protein